MSLKHLTYLILVINYVYGKEERIIGGSNAVRNHFPYQAVLKRISDNVVICGGSIISHYHILTAAHCVDENSITYSNLKIYLGGFNQTHEFTSEYLPYQIIIHPGYTGNSNEIRTLSNDIALIRTRQDIQFNYYQNLISLPKRNIYPDEVGTFSGWGAKTYPLVTFPDRLQRILMKVISRPNCQTSVPFIIRADQFCAFKAPGIGPCIGDGGSPLNRLGKLVGIFSMGNLCAQGVPDIFTNVYAHLPFIMSSMEL